ncbi:FadR/GntR family transcriptional regulator [Acidothermaceae bacterium B102]|nr:FadR/GntR family transcriptional regulator [Acidothermaceae bacterium B102]
MPRLARRPEVRVTLFAPTSTGSPRLASGRPARRSDALVDDLIERIVAGDISAGSAVPPEPTLCAGYGVSRTVVREAIKSLEEKGLVTAFQGIGTLVLGQDAWNLLDPHVLTAIVRHDEQYDVLNQLIAVRSAMESDMAAEAARRATPEDLAELAVLMDNLDASVGTPELMDELDVGFHQRIMLVSGNVLGRAIVRTVHAEARKSIRYLGHSSLADRRLTNAQHRAVLEAVTSGDAESASLLMAAHISTAWQRRRPRKRRTGTGS